MLVQNRHMWDADWLNAPDTDDITVDLNDPEIDFDSDSEFELSDGENEDEENAGEN